MRRKNKRDESRGGRRGGPALFMSEYQFLTGRSGFRIRLIVQGLAVGLVAGAASTGYRGLIALGESFASAALAGTLSIPFPALLMTWAGGALVLGRIMEWEPMATGSGIPQVEGELLGKLSMNWRKVLAAKIAGGALAAALGMSLGRGAPSIQIGAAAGKGATAGLKEGKAEKGLSLSGGAAAGFSAAFNAPLSGVIFVLEEIHKSFSPPLLLSAMMASLAADFLSKHFFGLGPVFSVPVVRSLPLARYGHLFLLGAFCGGGGAMFCRLILYSQSLFGKIPLRPGYKLLIPVMVAFCAGPFLPEILGGGQRLVDFMTREGTALPTLLLLFGGKLVFSAMCLGSGAPGGIFLPMLALGASLGAIYGTAAILFFNTDAVFAANFLVLGMAGFCAATVRAPITAIVLITEMTGSFSHLLPVSLVVITSEAAAGLLRSQPVYYSLLLRMLRKTRKTDAAGKVLLDGAICLGAPLDGKLLKDAPIPEGCLFVSIDRAGEEIIPKGDTRLTAGDRFTALADGSRALFIRERLQKLADPCPPDSK